MAQYYEKINTIFQRDTLSKKHPIIIGSYSKDEFELLQDIKWEATEKIDGTNMSCEYIPAVGTILVRGKTEKANIPIHILDIVYSLFTKEKLETAFPSPKYDNSIIELFGEMYGNKIQPYGSKYIPNGQNFILFDIKITTNNTSIWLSRLSCCDIAESIGIDVVPLIGYYTLKDAVDIVSKGFKSRVAVDPTLDAEGLVLKTPLGLLDRQGNRIITKIKTVDFKYL